MLCLIKFKIQQLNYMLIL